MKCFTCIQHSLMSMQTLVGREQRWMNIQDSGFVCCYKFAGKDSHEAGQHNQLRLIWIQDVKNLPVITGPVGVFFRIDKLCCYTGPLCALQCKSIGNITKYNHNFNAQLAISVLVDHRLQI